MSVVDKWDALQNVQMVQIPLDCIMRKDKRVNIALEQACKFILLTVPWECRLPLVLFLDRERKEYIYQSQVAYHVSELCQSSLAKIPHLDQCL